MNWLKRLYNLLTPNKKKERFIMDEYITVRVGQVPGRIDDITLNGGRTVSDALEGASLDADGFEIRINGESAEMDATLEDGDTVLLVKKIKGN